MPLHLLGKKSWHVYNSANVERVKRDEAEAQAREEAEEQRLQQEDAEYRTKVLRGERPEAITSDTTDVVQEDRKEGRSQQHPRKRRRLNGEDDTDRDIRWAREDVETGQKVSAVLSKHQSKDTPLHDPNGHIQLVPVPDAKEASKIERNAEAEAEKARRKRRDEDQYTMRFSNAAGFKNDLSAPWYAGRASTTRTTDVALLAVPEKNVWGDADPRRREREQKRVTSSDPLAFMQQAQRQLKQSEKDRGRWREEHEAELRDLRREQRLDRKHHLPELEPFSLDASDRISSGGRETRHHRRQHDLHASEADKHARKHRHHHRRCSKSRHRE